VDERDQVQQLLPGELAPEEADPRLVVLHGRQVAAALAQQARDEVGRDAGAALDDPPALVGDDVVADRLHGAGAQRDPPHGT
jgi:hypothetical protein